ncbi:MAG: alpha-L-fucosidase [Spirochaetaceae bacterium]
MVEEKIENSWESLINHGIPEWMLDQKFGIYAHLGLYSVPGFGNEWYEKHMHDPSSDIYQKHIDEFGPTADFSYLDFLPKLTADKFDAAEWAELFKLSGANYAGLSLAHHDGFGLWDSDVYKWNVGKMGPKRDLYGELATEIKKRGMKLVAPFHILRGYNWVLPEWNQWDQSWNEDVVEQGKKEGWQIFDAKYKNFYWNQIAGADYKDFLLQWKESIKEVIDKYEPDLMWFDGGRFSLGEVEQYTLEVLSYYLNKSIMWEKEVGVFNKLPVSLIYNFPEEFGISQFEEGRDRPEVMTRPWNDDMKISHGSWGWTEGQTYRSGKEILHGLIDRTARGGSLMLSLCPKADGSICEEQKTSLRIVGEWLKYNDEAITGTRPWLLHGEGDIQKLKVKNDKGKIYWKYDKCNGNDIRYTMSKDGNIIYGITLGWPGDNVYFKSLGLLSKYLNKEISHIQLLGSKSKTVWKQDDSACNVKLDPNLDRNLLAYTWRIRLK